MRTYLVFEPAAGGRGADAADQVVFLREKFSWLALFFAPLWLLWHRLWLGLAGWLVCVALISVAAYALGLPSRSAAIAAWLPSLVVAFEGSELRRRKLLRRGFREVSVAVGEDLEDAERRFFAGWSEKPRAHSPIDTRPNPPPPPPSASPNQVIGLFPEPGGNR